MASEVARADLQRLADAKVLLAAKSWSNTYYLAGYAIELALKACIAKQFKADTIPDRKVVEQTYKHNFRDLVGTANLGPDFQSKQGEAAFVANWGVVSSWSPDARYQGSNEQSARDLIAAIEDATNGVLVWIKAHW